jgi:ASC-1-like (ASCH) protein
MQYTPDIPRLHLAVMRRGPLERLLTGEKRIESRLSRHRIVPHGRVSEGDRIFFKEGGGPVRATALVTSAHTFRLEGESDVEKLRALYDRWIRGDDAFWSEKRTARWATLMALGDVSPLPPLPVPKTDRRPWVVFEEKDGERDPILSLLLSLTPK